MNTSKIWLENWFKSRESQVTLSPEENYFEAGAIDSLGIIELIEDMEKAFSVQFSQDDFQDQRFYSINGLVEIIIERQHS